MKQYQVVYRDKSSEIVEAYDYTLSNGRATFDLGRRCDKLICLNVLRVELLA